MHQAPTSVVVTSSKTHKGSSGTRQSVTYRSAPAWFYHAAEDLQVKSLAHLLDIYHRSVGRNSLLLLNVPPDSRGLLHEQDVARLRELRAAIDATYATDLTRVLSGEGDSGWNAPEEQAMLELELGADRTFDRLLLQEDIEQGQRVEGFVLEAWHDGGWKPVVRGGCIGYKRLERFGRVTASRVRLCVEQSRGPARLKRLGLFCQP